jgi:hypothetical protein
VDLVLVGGRSKRRTQSARTTTAVAVVAAVLAIFTGAALADVAPGTDFRVSNAGVDGDTQPGAFNPDVAYNSTDNQYLEVWYGDGDSTFDYEIYGQRVDANGNEIGSDFLISNADPPGNLTRIALDPAVAYNSTNNEYLVIWYADEMPTDNEYEVWGQRLSASGAELGSDFRISNMGPDNSTTRTPLRDPEVAYDATSNEYLAVWAGNNMGAVNKYEIWGQRITAAGAEVQGTAETSCADAVDSDGDGLINDGCPVVNGTAETQVGNQCINALDDDSDGTVNDGCAVNSDFRISNTGGDTDPSRGADNPVVATNTSNGEYMVAWYGNPSSAAGENEIYGQVLSQAGAEVGGDFRISNVGPEGNGLYEPGVDPPAIAYDSADNQFLVTWYGNDPPLQKDEYEIFGQRLTAAGAEVNGDFRISNVGTDGDTARNTFAPAVTYNAADNQYLVAWYGDIGAEIEVCGQKLAGASGSEVGGDVRLSHMGPDNDAAYAGFFPALAWNSAAHEFLATWYGDDTTDNEFEVYARRVGTAEPCSSGVIREPPQITALGHSSRHLTASWSLSSGIASYAIEAATSPAVRSDGFFADATTVLSDETLAPDSRSYTSGAQLPPGTYYVHIAAYNSSSPNCVDPTHPACVLEFSDPVAVTIPPDPPSGGTNPPPGGGSSKVPTLKVGGQSSQKALRKKAIIVTATCDQACTLTASGRLSIPGVSKSYRLRSIKRSLTAGKKVTLKLKLSKKVIQTAKRALRKHKRIRATVRLTAKNSAGTKASRKVIRITG